MYICTVATKQPQNKHIMNYNKYQSQEWVNIQIEIEEDENSGSIMDEFKIN